MYADAVSPTAREMYEVPHAEQSPEASSSPHLQNDKATSGFPASASPQFQRSLRGSAAFSSQPPAGQPSQDMLDWVNDHLPYGVPQAVEWPDLSSGRLYIRLVENLSGRQSGIKDADFDTYRPLQVGGPLSME